jgi:uncharacterized protein (DUF1330 family)
MLMAAYFMVDVDVRDRKGMQDYVEHVPRIIEKYGGRYLVRGGKLEVFEGDWQPELVVVLEFPNIEQAKRWYHCEEYKEFKAARLKATDSSMILVEGV